MLVVSLGGSPSLKSRSHILLQRAIHWLQQGGVEVSSFQVRDFNAEDLSEHSQVFPDIKVTPRSAPASATS